MGTEPDAFIAAEDALDREALQEWLPDCCDRERARGDMSYPRAMGLHWRPDVEICRRLTGIRQLIGKAELIGVAARTTGSCYAPLEA